MARFLLIGKGGREYALAQALLASDSCSELLAVPGSDAIAEFCPCRPLDLRQQDSILALAREVQPDLVVIGPEDPLAAGFADALEDAGFLTFGPKQNAAAIESSKSWAKAIMQKAGVPTAGYTVFRDRAALDAALRQAAYPLVLKADGLHAGKGVAVCFDAASALAFAGGLDLDENNTVLLEDYLDGFEFSLIVAADGERFFAFPPAQDHKRIHDGNQGPNTGGMGAVSPVPRVSEALVQETLDRVIRPTLKAMADEGCPFRGFLYAGLMAAAGKLYVIEFNARFGDPEAEVLLPRLQGDFAGALLSLCRGTELPPLSFRNETCLGVVLASPGYPGSVTDSPILPPALLDAAAADPQIRLQHMGTRHLTDGRYQAAGGRVLMLSCLAPGLEAARDHLYGFLSRFEDELAPFQYRRDIGLYASEA